MRETNTCLCCISLSERFSLELKSRCRNNDLGRATNRHTSLSLAQTAWPIIYSLPVTQWLGTADKASVDRRTMWSRERIVARTTVTRCPGWTRFVEQFELDLHYGQNLCLNVLSTLSWRSLFALDVHSTIISCLASLTDDEKTRREKITTKCTETIFLTLHK